MKALSLVLLLSASILAAEKPLLVSSDPPAIASPSLAEKLDAGWSIAKGTWKPEAGVMTGAEIAAEKHAAVLHHTVGLSTAVIELDFKLQGPGTFLVGCDNKTHVGRVVVKPTGIDIAEDSAKPSHVIASLKTAVAPDAWHHLRVEWQGDQMAARLDGQELKAQHPFLATPKLRSWLAVGGKSAAQIKSLTIRGVKTAAE